MEDETRKRLNPENNPADWLTVETRSAAENVWGDLKDLDLPEDIKIEAFGQRYRKELQLIYKEFKNRNRG